MAVHVAEFEPGGCALLQRIADRVVLEHQQGIKQPFPTRSGPALNVVQGAVLVFAQRQVLRLQLLHPLRHRLLRARAGDHWQCVDEQPQLLLHTTQLCRTTRHRRAEAHTRLPGVTLQKQ
ncbi:hypothetical protein D3C76_1063650 [compost metagenome]